MRSGTTKQTDDAAGHRLALLEAAVASMVDAVVLVDVGGMPVSMNEAGRHLGGHSLSPELPLPGQLLGMEPRRLDGRAVPAEELPVAMALRGQIASDSPLLIRGADGSDAIISATANPVRDDQGEIIGAVAVFRDVTRQHRAEDALRDSERLLQRVFASLRDAVFVIDAETTRVIACNPAVSELFGYSPEDVIGRTTAFLHVDEAALEEFRRHLYSAVAEKGYLHLPNFAMRRKDGTIFPSEHSVVPLTDEKGKRTAWVSIVHNISRRRRVEAELEALLYETRLWALQLDTVIENTDAQLAVLDRDLRFVMANSAYIRGCGHTKEELLGRNHFELFPNEENEAIFRRVRDTGEPYQVVEKPFEYADQPERGVTYWNWILVPLNGADGTVERLVFSLVDVTPQVLARQKAERLAEESGRRAAELETILQSMADGVFVCDGHGGITMANGAALRLIGERVGRGGQGISDCLETLELLSPDGRPIPAEDLAISRALRGEVVTGQEGIATIPATGEKMDLLISAAPILGEMGDVVGAVQVIRDVSELRELDRLRDQFIAVAAHELKTPVAIMKGFAQILLRRSEGITPEQRRILEAIDRGANRIDGVVQDLLDVSVLSSGELRLSKERVDLAEFVGQIVDKAALSAPKHRLRLLHVDPIVVQADPIRLARVVESLVDNALRYSPRGGNVDIEIHASGEGVTVSVADHGVGIPLTKQGRVFQRFYRAHTGTPYDYGGLGVDLYISREIIVRHGGEMSFESEEGVGSTFRFTLPMGGTVAID